MDGTWDPAAWCGPMFEPLRSLLDALDGPRRPSLADLQRLVALHGSGIASGGGKPLRLVSQGPKSKIFAAGYEPRVFLAGELQVRENDWHDFFNVLVWLSFPRSKAALNARHYTLQQVHAAGGRRNRNAAQDALTLFDESGVIVVASDPELLDLLRRFAWKELFWTRRARSAGAMDFVLFGHALYEKALRPYVGMTGHSLLFGAPPSFFEQPLASRLAELDAMVAGRIAQQGTFLSTRELQPLPVLGVPGWSEDNDKAAYYDNTAYFRQGRRQA